MAWRWLALNNSFLYLTSFLTEVFPNYFTLYLNQALRMYRYGCIAINPSRIAWHGGRWLALNNRTLPSYLWMFYLSTFRNYMP
nr:hypothetical protein Q903MT_gene1014 [Picea sitchensis]